MSTEIKLVRVDFRLLHGQVVTNWIKQVSADAVLIINDELVQDKFLANVFLMAAPPGVKVGIRSIEKAVEGLRNNVFKNKKLLILFKSVQDVKRAVDLGLEIKELQIGGLGIGSGTNKVMISKELSLSKEEAKMLKDIEDKGIQVSLQVTPKDSKILLKTALKEVLGE
ncbi:MAG: PTS sugar transporter subunit IIB [Streptococcaceae bacterium]|jgi:mannose/fructose/N-acetylgalactosamine-specific phosphotransferase system component IIB|nr:PTS sugar transporter subunit IIB [Streptococcaceae bacterium]